MQSINLQHITTFFLHLLHKSCGPSVVFWQHDGLQLQHFLAFCEEDFQLPKHILERAHA
jgi:hypothetical protein